MKPVRLELKIFLQMAHHISGRDTKVRAARGCQLQQLCLPWRNRRRLCQIEQEGMLRRVATLVARLTTSWPCAWRRTGLSFSIKDSRLASVAPGLECSGAFNGDLCVAHRPALGFQTGRPARRCNKRAPASAMRLNGQVDNLACLSAQFQICRKMQDCRSVLHSRLERLALPVIMLFVVHGHFLIKGYKDESASVAIELTGSGAGLSTAQCSFGA